MSTSYTSPYPGGWVNDPAGGSRRPGDTPLDADAVTVLDQGIGLAHDRLDSVNSSISGAVVAANQATARVASLSTLPTYAPTGLSHGYDAIRNVYNWTASNTRRTRAGLAVAANAGIAHVIIVGDSESEMFNGVAMDQLNAWPRVMASTLVGLGVPSAGTGYVKAYSTGPTADPRWSFSAGWVTAFASFAYTDAVAGRAATFTADASDGVGTGADVWFYGGSGNCSITAKDTGGTTLGTATWTYTGTALATKVSLGGLVGVKSVVVTTTAANPAIVFGATIYRASGLLVNNCALYGTATGGWVTPSVYALPAQAVGGATPATVFCALGVNDLNGSVPIATVITNLTTIRGQFPNSDFILIGQYQPSGITLTAWQAYIAALYTLADTLDCPLIDLTDRSGGYALASANGLMGDGLHPDRAAHADTGRNFGLVMAS